MSAAEIFFDQKWVKINVQNWTPKLVIKVPNVTLLKHPKSLNNGTVLNKI